MAPHKAAIALWTAASASLLLSGAAVEAAVRQKKVVVTFELVNGSFVPVVREVKDESQSRKKVAELPCCEFPFQLESEEDKSAVSGAIVQVLLQSFVGTREFV